MDSLLWAFSDWAGAAEDVDACMYREATGRDFGRFGASTGGQRRGCREKGKLGWVSSAGNRHFVATCLLQNEDFSGYGCEANSSGFSCVSQSIAYGRI